MNDTIKQIAEREFKGAEFKAGIKQGGFCFNGTFTRKNREEHYKKAKEVFE